MARKAKIEGESRNLVKSIKISQGLDARIASEAKRSGRSWNEVAVGELERIFSAKKSFLRHLLDYFKKN